MTESTPNACPDPNDQLSEYSEFFHWSEAELKKIRRYAEIVAAYWKVRAETAESKILTFHEEIAGLNRESATLRKELAEAKQDTNDVYADYQDAVKRLHQAEQRIITLEAELAIANAHQHLDKQEIAELKYYSEQLQARTEGK